MHAMTAMSLNELSYLMKHKSVHINNSDLIFGKNFSTMNNYFKDRIGNDGYVLCVKGKISAESAKLFSQLDSLVKTGEHLIIEADIPNQDFIRYSVTGLEKAFKYLYHGLPDSDVFEGLDEAVLQDGQSASVEIICVPEFKRNMNLRVTSMRDTITFQSPDIKFVKLGGEK